ncbi:hypothetical protein RRG08_045634 [Elysia crispata]|uniref:Uncharacterized protein n=1 Tax=Elysia crispata TaxID=231223 RepID=A0AAE0XYR6_9GAST|nr:hypothetical protein RRG08_045634 [Elysia crispata]
MWELSGCHRGIRQNTGVWKLENVGTLGVSQRDKTARDSSSCGEWIRQHEIREAREWELPGVSQRDKNTEVWKLRMWELGVSQRDKTEHGSLEARECGNSRGVTEG